jgi:GDPmannose 4,6-dehydratase
MDQSDPAGSSVLLNDFFLVDLRNPLLLPRAIESAKPDEIYYLAALNFSNEDERLRSAPVADVLNVNLTSAAATLSIIAARFPSSRFFFAGSCHVFGRPNSAPQNETTPHNPTSPYGLSKSAGLRLCRYFRESCSVFAVGGILFNHESPLRQPPFISARIARAAALAAVGRGARLEVHDLEAIVDWGAAADYVEAMWHTMNQSLANDYVIATGIGHTVGDFARVAFEHVGEDWQKWIGCPPNELKEAVIPYVGDPSRITNATGWRPTTTFEQLVGEMVDAYRNRPLREV